MNQDELKRSVAAAAVLELPDDEPIGVGSGSTVNCFIVSPGAKTTRRLVGV